MKSVFRLFLLTVVIASLFPFSAAAAGIEPPPPASEPFLTKGSFISTEPMSEVNQTLSITAEVGFLHKKVAVCARSPKEQDFLLLINGTSTVGPYLSIYFGKGINGGLVSFYASKVLAEKLYDGVATSCNDRGELAIVASSVGGSEVWFGTGNDPASVKPTLFSPLSMLNQPSIAFDGWKNRWVISSLDESKTVLNISTLGNDGLVNDRSISLGEGVAEPLRSTRLGIYRGIVVFNAFYEEGNSKTAICPFKQPCSVDTLKNNATMWWNGSYKVLLTNSNTYTATTLEDHAVFSGKVLFNDKGFTPYCAPHYGPFFLVCAQTVSFYSGVAIPTPTIWFIRMSPLLEYHIAWQIDEIGSDAEVIDAAFGGVAGSSWASLGWTTITAALIQKPGAVAIVYANVVNGMPYEVKIPMTAR